MQQLVMRTENFLYGTAESMTVILFLLIAAGILLLLWNSLKKDWLRLRTRRRLVRRRIVM